MNLRGHSRFPIESIQQTRYGCWELRALLLCSYCFPVWLPDLHLINRVFRPTKYMFRKVADLDVSSDPQTQLLRISLLSSLHLPRRIPHISLGSTSYLITYYLVGSSRLYLPYPDNRK